MVRFISSICFLLFVVFMATTCMAWPSKTGKGNMRPHIGLNAGNQQTAPNGQVDCTATDCTLSCASGSYGYACSDGTVFCYCDD